VYTCDAVEEEVDTVVDKDKKVVDGLGVLVSLIGTMFPVRLANQQHDARRYADQERE